MAKYRGMNIFSSLNPIQINGRKDQTSHDEVLVLPERYRQFIFISITNARGQLITLEKQVGDSVLMGTRLGVRQDFYVPIFSSVSGKIVDQVDLYHPILGRMTPHFVIENDGMYTQDTSLKKLTMDASQEAIISAIKEAGIIGLGGAGFPTYIKYEGTIGKKVDTVLINGVECEPYLSTDYHAALEEADALLTGTELLRKAANASEAIVAFKQTKVAIKEVLEPKLAAYPHIHLKTTPDVYPMGWEKILIKQLFKKDYQKLPIEAGIVVNNLTTAIHVAKALLQGIPIVERVLTFSGEALLRPANVRMPLGVIARDVVTFLGGYKMETATAFIGGPMSSKSVTDDGFSIQAAHGAFTVIPPVTSQEEACLRCGACTASCPALIQPIEIKNALDRNQTDRLLKLDPMKCVECGICTYVCPSKIEVTEAVRQAKLRVRLELTKQGLIKPRV